MIEYLHNLNQDPAVLEKLPKEKTTFDWEKSFYSVSDDQLKYAEMDDLWF